MLHGERRWGEVYARIIMQIIYRFPYRYDNINLTFPGTVLRCCTPGEDTTQLVTTIM